MKKIAFIISACILFGSSAVMAQGEMDAYRLSRTDVNGTARYLGMGGAFGALGGDVSAMYTNPAGLGIYRTSEIVFTTSLNINQGKSDWFGSKADESKTKFNLDNFAYVGYFPTGNDEGLVGWNVGFSYNKLMNFNRKYAVSGFQDYSLAEYIGVIAEGYDNLWDDNAYNTKTPWLATLGAGSGMIERLNNNRYHSTFSVENNDGTYSYVLPDYSELFVHEWGGIDQYNFSFATNISNVFFVGANFSVTDINYRMSSGYDEKFVDNAGSLYLDNNLSTDGTGYAFNIGVIARPVDFLRLGVAYNSPTWYKMTDYFIAEGYTYNNLYDNGPVEESEETPGHSYGDYELRTPDKWIFSAAGIIGTKALISVDYELSNFHQMKLYDANGRSVTENEYIKEDYRSTHMIRLGAEYKITPQLAIRAGGIWQTSAAKTELQNNEVEVYTAGTQPHFTADKGMNAYSFGLGYRFTPNFYMDLAYVFRQYKENSYMFSNVYDKEGYDLIPSDVASLKTNTNRIALTFGYKF